MTTIRAHVPVKTPAGLVMALPPKFYVQTDESCNCGFGGFHDDINPRCRRNATIASPDVFDLAVPCPHVGMHRTHDCSDGWVLHGRYRVLDVLHRIRRTNLYPEHADAFSLLGDRTHIVIDHADLPAAVPGGVALIVEALPANDEDDQGDDGEYDEQGPEHDPGYAPPPSDEVRVEMLLELEGDTFTREQAELFVAKTSKVNE